METFTSFCSNYSDGNNHIERIPVAVKNTDHLFRMTSEILESDTLHLFLLLESMIMNT